MLGHKLLQVLSAHFETYATARSEASLPIELVDRRFVIDNVSAQDFDSVVRAFTSVRPTVVINCIGIVKQLPSAQNSLVSIEVNSLFPHRVAELCRGTGARFITISTDCVFAGTRGLYTEEDTPDCTDLYGRTKLLGEVDAEGALTIRTSIVGRQLSGDHALVEWFLRQEGGSVKGYKNALFSGFTTSQLSEIILRIIKDHPQLSGIRHVSADPISKLELLKLIRTAFDLDIRIEPDEALVIDRTLVSEKFQRETGIRAPSWPDMIRRLSEESKDLQDSKLYPRVGKLHAN